MLLGGYETNQLRGILKDLWSAGRSVAPDKHKGVGWVSKAHAAHNRVRHACYKGPLSPVAPQAPAQVGYQHPFLQQSLALPREPVQVAHVRRPLTVQTSTCIALTSRVQHSKLGDLA